MSIRTFSRAALLVGAVSVATTATSAGPLERSGVRDVTLPAGTLLPLTLDSYVASDTSRIESPVRAHLRRAVFVDGDRGAPGRDACQGLRHPGAAVGPREGSRPGRLPLHVDGRGRRPLSRRDVERRAPGARDEEAGRGDHRHPRRCGALIGGLTKGGKGAAVGSAVGGAAGTGVVLATRGKEVRLGRGAPVAVRLLRPVRVSI